MNKWYFPMVFAACLLSACSSEPDDAFYNGIQEDSNKYADIASTLKSAKFFGDWSINGKPVELQLSADYFREEDADLEYHYLYSEEGKPRVAFYRFPFAAVARQFFPSVVLSGIVADVMIGTPFTPEEQLLVKTTMDHGDNAYCISPALSLPLRVVGYSGQTLYCELGGNYRYYPFVIKEPDGNYFAIVLHLLPASTTFVIKPESLNAQITIERVEVIGSDGSQSEIVPQPAMTIKFTSKEKK